MGFGGLGGLQRVEGKICVFETGEAPVDVDAAALAAHWLERRKSVRFGCADLRGNVLRCAAAAVVFCTQTRPRRKTRQRYPARDDALELAISGARIEVLTAIGERAVALHSNIPYVPEGLIDRVDAQLGECGAAVARSKNRQTFHVDEPAAAYGERAVARVGSAALVVAAHEVATLRRDDRQRIERKICYYSGRCHIVVFRDGSGCIRAAYVRGTFGDSIERTSQTRIQKHAGPPSFRRSSAMPRAARAARACANACPTSARNSGRQSATSIVRVGVVCSTT